MSADTLYCYVRDNWRELKNKLIDYYSANIENFECVNDDLNQPPPLIKTCKLLDNLNIAFTEIEWKSLFKQDKLEKNAWTHLIFAKFYEK